LSYAHRSLAPYQRIRRIEFMELPKTISGKIRRVELRTRENSSQMFPRASTATVEATAGRAAMLTQFGQCERIDAGVCRIAGEVTLTRDP
jgi:hypothetical protein